MKSSMRAAVVETNQITNIILVDDLSVFPNLKWLSNKSTLNIGDDYDETLAYAGETPPASIVNIVIDNVTNTLSGFGDGPLQHTVDEQTNIVASGTGLKALADAGFTTFRVPFNRLGPDGVPDSKRYWQATIAADGSFSITLNFKTGGEWVVNSALLNSELSAQEKAMFNFAIDEHRFKVM